MTYDNGIDVCLNSILLSKYPVNADRDVKLLSKVFHLFFSEILVTSFESHTSFL